MYGTQMRKARRCWGVPFTCPATKYKRDRGYVAIKPWYDDDRRLWTYGHSISMPLNLVDKRVSIYGVRIYCLFLFFSLKQGDRYYYINNLFPFVSH